MIPASHPYQYWTSFFFFFYVVYNVSDARNRMKQNQIPAGGSVTQQNINPGSQCCKTMQACSKEAFIHSRFC